MSTIITLTKNALDEANVTVSLSSGAEDADFPLYRIYDRDIGKLFKSSDEGVNLIVNVDQSNSPIEVDRLIIPAGHTLNGFDCELEGADSDSSGTSWTSLVSWTQGDADIISKSFTPSTYDYLQFTIDAVSSGAPVRSFSELYIPPSYTWERNPTLPAEIETMFNVERNSDASGVSRFLERGDPKRRRSYQIVGITTAQRTNLEALNADWAGKKPFYLIDHEGITIFGELIAPIVIVKNDITYSAGFEFLEVLP